MTGFFGKPGFLVLVFAAFALAFNWPLLGIPAPESLLDWIFTAWALLVVALFMAARSITGKAATQPSGADRERAEGGHV